MLEKIDLFEVESGEYRSFRIPALAITPQGAILAFTSARRKVSDWSHSDILMRRSMDGGTTWAPASVVAQEEGETVDNPVPIVDRKMGTVHFLHQINYRRCYYLRSDDDGQTFTKPIDITNTFEAFRPEYNWTVIAPGPGHGIQLESGRLLAPVWLSDGGGKAHRPSCVSTIYSDDHGRTWQRGEIVVRTTDLTPNPSESTALELADGRVMLNIRCESRRYRRLVSFSPDGATGWSEPTFDDALFDPICFASLIRLTKRPPHDRNRILFSNPNSGSNARIIREYGLRLRENITVRLSYDEGETWPIARALEAGRAGYSDMAVASDGAIYCLYERGFIEGNDLNTRFLTIARFDLEWLTDGKDRYVYTA